MSANLLIIDALPQSRSMVRAHLELAGYSTQTAADGYSALDCLSQQDFELVISDIRAPGPSGLELLRATQRASPATEVVIVASGSDQSMAAECLRAGAFDLLQKPINTYDLLSTVSRALERNQLRAAAGLHEANVGRLSAGVVHELNNPVTGVLTDLTLLSEGLAPLAQLADLYEGPGLPPEVHAIVEQMGGPEGLRDLHNAAVDAALNARRVRQISQDLKLLARPGTSAFALNDAINAALRLESGALRRAELSLECSLDPAMTMTGSAGRLCQVFMNLVGVATRRPVTADALVVSAAIEGCQVTVSFLLRGAAAPQVPLIAEEDPSLSVSREITRAHGGDLFTSIKPEGVAFIVTLPMW